MISNPTLHVTLIHGNPLSNSSPIHTTLHLRMIQTHLNTPLHGNLGRTGKTGATLKIQHSQQEDGRTTRSPGLHPTKRVNGSITQNPHFQTTPLTTLPPVRSRHFPLKRHTVTTIPNAINDVPDQLNPDNPRSLQDMYHWTFMVAAPFNGKQL